MIPLDCSSIKCLCFTAMKCRSGTHFTEGLFGPLQYAPPEPLFLNYFIESFLPSIKDDREMQDVASGGCILSERFFAKCCPYLLTMLWKESAFYRGKLGQPWVLRCFKSICWPVWNRYSSWNWQSRVCHIYIYIHIHIYIYPQKYVVLSVFCWLFLFWSYMNDQSSWEMYCFWFVNP